MTQLGDDPVHAIPATHILRRSRGRWRIFAFLALAIAIAALVWRFAPELAPTEKIARVEMSGTITTDHRRLEMFDRLAEDESVSGVILAINSPGGTTAGGEVLYQALKVLSAQKPTVAVIGELGASAAYMTAIGTDQIFARRLSIIGSIGVLYRHVDAGRLLDTIGIDLDKVASGELKAEPDFDEPISPAVRESLATLVEDSFSWFVDVVAAERDLSRSQVLALADGRIMTGSMGVEAGLIDAIGGQSEALRWLASEHGIDPDLAIVSAWPPPSRTGWIPSLLGQTARDLFGLDIERAIALDGLVSLWHPSGQQ